MSFLDKIKGFFNVDGAKIEIHQLESPFDFGKTTWAGAYAVTSTIAETLNEVEVKLYAAIPSAENGEDAVVLAQESSQHNPASGFPLALQPHQAREIPIQFAEINLAESLAPYGIKSAEDAVRAGVRFYVRVEIDVKEAAGLFDPYIEKEIFVK